MTERDWTTATHAELDAEIDRLHVRMAWNAALGGFGVGLFVAGLLLLVFG